MKKGLSILAAIVMVFALAVPALAEADSAAGVWSEVSVVGAWTPAVVESAGELLTPAEVGIDFYMEILGDGTCEIMRNGQSATATWSREGSSVVMQDDLYGEQRFELMEDGTLTAMADEDMTVVFVRDGALTAAGLWTAASVTAGSETFDPAEMEMDLTMDLAEDGACALTLNGRSEAGSWTQYGMNVVVWDAQGAVQRFELMEDGTLRAELGIQTLTLVREGAAEAEKAVTDSES